ncbi:MAG: hypothetical protein AAF382_03415 [Pseudomonadota bacterium]
MRIWGLSAVATLALTGCGVVPDGLFGPRDRPDPVVEVAPAPEEGAIPEDARTAEEFDTTSADDRAAALEAASSSGGETELGTTIATLGDVTQTGIWLKTPLVSEAAQGRVKSTENGKAVAVDLIPLEADPGAGSRISLAAMRLLEVDLTSLAELQVYRSN